jgi:[ribosomal protein S5]-alanine N-acetyltransferase
MITFETKRLLLRQFQLEDAKFYFEMNNDPQVIRYTGDKPFKSIEESEELIRNYEQYNKYKSGRLSVILKETGQLLGWCGLKYHEEEELTDIGYRFKKEFWNKGYATEAGQASIDYGFSVLGLKEIVGHAMPDNEASIRVFKKLGMHYVKDVIAEGNPSVLYMIRTK